MRVNEAHFGQAAYNHFTSLLGIIDKRNSTQLIEFDFRIILSNDACVGCCITSYTTSVEGTERQLRTRLTNSLCGNDTSGFTQLHHTGSS